MKKEKGEDNRTNKKEEEGRGKGARKETRMKRRDQEKGEEGE